LDAVAGHESPEEDEPEAKNAVELIDRQGAARSHQQAKRAPKKAKSKGAAKRSANQKGRKPRLKTATQAPLVWWKQLLGGRLERAHLITLAWVLSPPAIIMLLYLFVFVL